MAISPAEAEREAVALRRLFAEAEQIIISLMARRLASGMDTPDWASRKLLDLARVQGDIAAEVARLQAAATTQLTSVMEQAYLQGMNSAFADMVEVGIERSALVRTNVATAQAFAREAERQLQGTHLRILRQADDVYRQAVAEGTRGAATGVETRRQAAQRVLNTFADKGVTGFVDSAGRNWSLDSYAEMSTRSALGRAAIQGHVDTLIANDRDLVIVSDSPEECPWCRRWEGKVLSLSGRTPGYPTMADAQGAGLFHANCTHTTGLYTPGLTRPMKGTANPQGYEERQKQRGMERQVRHWKRREAAALDDTERAKAKGKVREWQGSLREFTSETDRRRQYQRESITRAH